MRIKLLLLVLLVSTMNAFSQPPQVGDYQSIGSGNWTNPAIWQIYQTTPTIGWVTATNYPGQITGTNNVLISAGNVISFNSNITTSSFGTLTIRGELSITNNQDVTLNATGVNVIQNSGIIRFTGNANLYLPANTPFTVYPGGILTSGPCNNSQRIYIGTIWLASCLGAGNGPMLSFSQLMNTNGSLTGILEVVYDCDKATITPRHIGLITGSNREYQMIVKNPANDTILNTGLIPYDPANLQSYTIDIPQLSIYIIELTFKIVYPVNQQYSSTRYIDLYSYIRWDGTSSSWIPSYLNPDVSIRAMIDGNYNTGTHGSFSACSLVINNGANVTIGSNTYIETQYNITNNGTLNIQNGGSLVQIDNNATFTGANNTVTRTTRPMIGLDPDDPTQVGTDFVYWGSPTNSNPTIPSSFDSSQSYQWNTTGGDEEWEGAWVPFSNNLPGRGFITGVASTIVEPTELNFTFSGILNSGPPILLPVDVYGNYDPDNIGLLAASGNMVLLGNPYPSAISATSFVTQNAARQIGTLYFWTSVSVFNSNNDWLYNQADYASWNLTGPTATAPPDTSGLLPEGYIASGQGFFVEMYNDGDVVFNNSMRVTDYNNQFFRLAEGETSNATSDALERHRIWLNLSDGNEMSRQMMMGYIEGATNGLDLQYDAKSFTTNELDLYTVLENKELAIQGRGLPFNDSDIIPLGYRVTNAGMYAITLSETDGLFKAYSEIYLKDKVTNTLYNLKKGAYEFNAQAGTFNNRFEIHFREQPLENNPIAHENNLVIFGANKALNVNSYESNIQSVELFDLVGKRIFSASELNVESYVSPSITAASPLLIARVTLINNQVVTKKVILK